MKGSVARLLKSEARASSRHRFPEGFGVSGSSSRSRASTRDKADCSESRSPRWVCLADGAKVLWQTRKQVPPALVDEAINHNHFAENAAPCATGSSARPSYATIPGCGAASLRGHIGAVHSWWRR